jgi:hemolysin activation/secretion protein
MSLPRPGPRARILAAAACATALAAPASAQPFERPAQERPPLPRYEEPAKRPELELPELPALELTEREAPGPRTLLREVEIEGSTVFTQEELRERVAPWIGREIGSEDLVALRDALTRLYVEHGYLNSGAVIPDQDLQGGVLHVRIVEGRLASIEIEGASHYRPSVLEDRLELGASVPLDVSRLEERLQLLQQDPRIERVNARLEPGAAPGEAVLAVEVEEARPWRVELEANNYANPAFGGFQGELHLDDENLLGFGDEIESRVTVAEGIVDVDGSYAIPVSARGTLVRLGGEWSRSKIVENPFSELDIRTRYRTARIGVEHPLVHTLHTQLRLGVDGEWRNARTTTCVFEDVLGGCDPLAFPGSGAREDGETTVSVLRFSQELVRRERDQVFAARSLLSVGLPILGATDRDLPPEANSIAGLTNPDGQFVAWLAQLQWARRFEPSGVQLILRVDAQLASDTLPSLERFPIGGHLSVRGYRENQIVRDEGVVASAELRLPLRFVDERVGSFQLAPFVDFGHATNRDNPTPSPENLTSIGVGLLWERGPFEASLYYGYGFEDAHTSGDLQDAGVQFRVGVRVF